jgi:hypothetical protein
LIGAGSLDRHRVRQPIPADAHRQFDDLQKDFLHRARRRFGSQVFRLNVALPRFHCLGPQMLVQIERRLSGVAPLLGNIPHTLNKLAISCVRPTSAAHLDRHLPRLFDI